MSAYYDEARKTWYVKFRYTDWTGAPKMTTKRGFKTKKEAVKYERDFKDRTKETAGLTMNALIDAYLEDRRVHTKTQSYITVKRIIDRNIRPTLGDMRLSDITKRTVREWENHMMEYVSPLTGRRLGDNSLKNISRQLSALFNYAMQFYDFPTNPVSAVGGIGKRKKSQSFWTEEQFHAFIAAIPEEDSYYRMVFNFLFYSGMRVGEFLALTPDDFDFDKNTVSINKSQSHYDKSITTPKTESSVRVITMPPSVMASVREYISHIYDLPERLFGATRMKLDWNMNKYIKAAGLPRISIHDLRHSHASHLIHSGVPITTISKRLGHSSPKITLDTYSHMYAESEADVANLLEKSFVGQTLVTR